MARSLSPTLEAQQKLGLISWPYVQARITKKWGNVIRYDWDSIYSGEEPESLHTATMPGDGSLIRLRVEPPTRPTVNVLTATLRPNGVGFETNIAYQFPAEGDHYDKVNEVVCDDDDTYVYSPHDSQGGGRDLYLLPDQSLTGFITKITATYMCKRHTHYDPEPTIYPSIRVGGNTYDGDLKVIESAAEYQPISQTWTVSPATGKPWTWAEIDELEVGLRITSAWCVDPEGWHSGRCSQVYLVVSYLEANAVGHDLYYDRVTNPDSESDFSTWDDLSIPDVVAVASCSLAAEVSQFYIDSDRDIHHRQSDDNGANWGAWAKIGECILADIKGFDATYKSNGDITLTFFDQPTLCQRLITGDTTAIAVYGATWRAQSFTTAQAHIILSVALKLYKVGNPGTLTVSIRATNVDHEPTGADLAVGTINGNNLTEDTEGEWYNIDLFGPELAASTEYAIVIRATAGDVDNSVFWRMSVANPYAGGQGSVSYNWGGSWSTSPTPDYMFEERGICTYIKNPSILHAIQRITASWGDRFEKPSAIDNATGVSLVHHNDWNIVTTNGDTSKAKAISICILGDGVKQASGTWSALQVIIPRTTTEPYNYHAPCLRRPDTTRLYFVENFTQEETQKRIWYSHAPPSATFDLNAWLEPVPMNIETEYGLALTQAGSYAWLTNANKVYRALATEDALVLTARLLEMDSRDYPDIFKGSLKVVLDNTGGWYNAFNRLGQQLEVGIGYRTPAGNEYSLAPFRWITKFKLVAPPWYPLRMIYPTGVVGTLEIETEDAWNFLYRYRTRRSLSWEAGEKSVKELLQFFIARCGLDFEVLSSSDAATNFKPDFEVRTGTSYRTAIKNLMKMIPDQLVFREAKVLLRNPTTAEAVDWTYHTSIGTALLVFRGKYGETAWDPNRTEVWGDTFMKMAAEWPQVTMVRDRLSRVTTPTYPDITRAAERADAELRKAEILTGEESWMTAPTNCGLEPWDILQITDLNAGVSSIRRRVLRIKSYWNARHWAYAQTITLGAD